MPWIARELPSEPIITIGERNISCTSSSDMEVTTIRVCPWSAARTSQAAVSGSHSRSKAASSMVRPAISGWLGEMAMRTASQDATRPKLVSPSRWISCLIRSMALGSTSRSSIASIPPAWTQMGSRLRRGLVPAV